MSGSKKYISYIKRNFWRQFFLAAILIAVIGIANIIFFKSTVGDEIIKLHQEILHQSVHDTAANIGGFKESLISLTENSQIIKWLEKDAEHAGQDELNNVDALVQSEIYANYKKRNHFRCYIFDLNGMRYSSDLAEVPWDLLKSKMENEADIEIAEDGIYLEGTVRGNEAGLYRYSFYMLRPVKDLLDGKVLGYMLLQISEKSVYDTYADLRGKDSTYYMVDNRGRLISGENKSKIGEEFGYEKIKSESEALAGHTELPKHRDDEMYFYENIRGTDWYLVERVNVHQILKALDGTGYFTFCMLIIFIVVMFLLTVQSGRNILKPIGEIKRKMSEVAEGNLAARISDEEKGNGEFSEISDSFNYMAQKLEQQVEEIRSIERKKHLLELDFLQAQINPHFIYNTLSSIRFYVEMGKNEEAEDMLIDFSKILRKTLSRSEKFVTLKEEIDTLNHYIRLQKARYRDRFEIEFDIQENTQSSLLPDFILQPIVENAIFYSLREDSVCHILISSYVKDKNLYVSVKDDGIGMDENKINTVLQKGLNMNKVGLKNVNERLKLNFGDIYGVKIVSEEGEGTEIILEMPCISERKRTI